MEIVHTPVLLNECLSYLAPEKENALFVDCTQGEGGHSFNFLKKFTTLSVIGLDADRTIQKVAKERLGIFGERVFFYSGNFSDFFADYENSISAINLCPPRKPDVALFDLGISIFHYEKSGRGFSFRYDEPLDMRIDTSSGEPASFFINSLSEEKLANLIFAYGEEKFSRRIAKAIVEARRGGKITSSKQLAEIIFEAVPSSYKHGAIHPATRTFQALRICVNGELERLPLALHNAFNCLEENGKLGVITFHSLEDRIVKNYFRSLSKECVCPMEQAVCTCGGKMCGELLTRKPLSASEEEVAKNSPSRSAKLRVIKKICDAPESRLVSTGINL